MQAAALLSSSAQKGDDAQHWGAQAAHKQHSMKARAWLFSPATLSNSPSRLDGLSEAEERRERRSGCAHIQAIVKGVLEEPFRNAKLADPSKASDAAHERWESAPHATRRQVRRPRVSPPPPLSPRPPPPPAKCACPQRPP